MKKFVIFCFTVLSNFISFSQNENEDWFAFWDKKTSLKGFKNSKGQVMIKPKFHLFTTAEVFKNIIPVQEKVDVQNDNDYKTKDYYLLKNGKKVGIDSLYIFDFTLDCENEGKIRFKDHKTNKVGFFDINGKVVIPAIYNQAGEFNNGFAVVIKDGVRICDDGSEYSKKNACEHSRWRGNVQIINDKNEVLIENLDFKYFYDIDWFSLVLNSKEIDPKDYTFKGKDGNSYTFKMKENEFEKWFKNEFLKQIEITGLINTTYRVISIQKNKNFKCKEFKNKKFKQYAWAIDTRENFYENNSDLLLNIIKLINLKKLNVKISRGFGPALIDYNFTPEFHTLCGEFWSEKFPDFEVFVESENNFTAYLLHFIKTKEGYKLVSIS